MLCRVSIEFWLYHWCSITEVITYLCATEGITNSAYVKIGDFPDEPIPPEVENPSKMSKTLHMFWAVLVGKWRKCYQMETVSQKSVILPSSFLRQASRDKILVQFVERNGDNYKHLLFGRTLSEHLESMNKPFVWGTQLELQAAANYYKMCISSPRESRKRGTIGIDTHQGIVLLQTTCHTLNWLTQDQYTLIPSSMLPHLRVHSPSLNWMGLQSTMKAFFSNF